MYAKVIVDISHTNVDRIFEYGIPDGMDVKPGMRVLAPFGGNKPVEGFVVGLSGSPSYDTAKIKNIIRPLEDFCALTGEQLELAEHIKQRYNTTLAAALRLMIPAQLRGGRVSAKTRNYCFLNLEGDELEKAGKLLFKKDGTPRYANQIEIIDRLKQAGEGMPSSVFSASALKSLEKKGVVRIEKSEVPRVPFDIEIPKIEDYELTETQNTIINAILGETDNKNFLLHGVTGSGKTEIYIRVIRNCLDAGKTAIMLVPEISLTPQTYLFLKQRFDCEIAVFHSGLSAGERYDEWLKVKRGAARIVLGARSAVFAPVENLGVIVIDEQHESSYKSDTYPNYSAIEIAKVRCGLNGAVLILGSATPDIETYYAAGRGEYKLLRMPERLFGLTLPSVEIVDMREEIKRGNRNVISGRLYEYLREALDNKRQAMLFLNRRGYATFVMCRACGYTVMCDACDVTLTYHKAQNTLKCHYCGRGKKVEEVCPECNKPYLKYFGTGTQQVEEQLKYMFPDARLMRMDLDTMSGKGAHLTAFEDFSAGRADILIGTQMITKGFDFERVAVSAVLAADTMLNIPDYRSAEYTFSQITQIAGRAGRKQAGNVVLQTYNPDHYAVRYAKDHDYEGFYKHEIVLRKMVKLPPFSVFVKIQFSGEDSEMVINSVKDFLKRLKTVLLPGKNDIISVRASESAIKKIDNLHRYHVLVNLGGGDATSEIFKLFASVKYKNVLTGIELNPAGLT